MREQMSNGSRSPLVVALLCAAACGKTSTGGGKAVHGDWAIAGDPGAVGGEQFASIECPAPESLAATSLPVWGFLCEGQLARLGLEGGVTAGACAKLDGSFSAKTRTCTLAHPIIEATGGHAVFCQGKPNKWARVEVELYNVTSDEPHADDESVETEGAIVGFTWQLTGSEPCRRHGNGHDVREGVADGLAHAADEVGPQLEILYRRSWELLAARATAETSWACLRHRKDN